MNPLDPGTDFIRTGDILWPGQTPNLKEIGFHMLRTQFAIAFGAALAITLSNAVSSASAEEQDDLDALSQAAPDVISTALMPVVEDDGDLSFDTVGGTVEVPRNPADGVALANGSEYRFIGLPVTDDAINIGEIEGVQIYENSDQTLSAVAVNDSVISLFTIVESSAAPTEFTYSYEQYGELRQSAVDGGVTIWDGSTQIGFLFEPWAYDANGVVVPAHYEVVGDTLTQVVEHQSGQYAYPIVADPTQTFPGSNSLYSKIIEDRNASTAEVIVRVTPNPDHSAAWHRVPRSTIIENYNAIVPSGYERQNLWDQLVCHAYNVPFNKGTWNLETWRPNVGYTATVLAACNPS